jgi:hypothetical protein
MLLLSIEIIYYVNIHKTTTFLAHSFSEYFLIIRSLLLKKKIIGRKKVLFCRRPKEGEDDELKNLGSRSVEIEKLAIF